MSAERSVAIKPAGASSYLSARLASSVGMAAVLATTGFLFVYPVAMLLIGIFRTARPGVAGSWTWSNFSTVVHAPATYRAFGNSLVFAITSTVIATALALLFAFLVARTRVPLRGLVTPVMLIIFAAPNLLYVVSWALLADPSGGTLGAMANAVGLGGLVNIYSWSGLIIVQSLKISSFCYLLLLPAFESMNRSFEEASFISGASRFQTFFRIDVPLLFPSITSVMMLGIVFGLGAFDVPQVLGGLARIQVLSTEIYKKLNYAFPPDYPGASALCLFMVLALVVMMAARRLVLRNSSFVTVTGKSFNNERWDIGRWNVAGAIAIVVFSMFGLVLPGIQLVLTSFQTAVGVYSFTLANYATVLNDAQTVGAFRLTLILAVFGGFLAMVVATVLGFVSRRSSLWMASLIDGAMLIPVVMPGVVLAVGLLWAYISLPGLRQLYGTIWFAFLGLVILTMPIASRSVQAALEQISPDLEEAAAISGAAPWRVLVDIVVKLIRRSFVAGWLVTAIIAAGTLDIPLMLLPPTTPNVAVLAYGYLNSALVTQASAVLVLLLACIAFAALTFAIVRAVTSETRSRKEQSRSLKSIHDTLKDEER